MSLFLLAAAVAAADVPQPVHLEGTPMQGALLRGRVPAGASALEFDGRAVPVAPDGRFLLGFDRDQAPAATLTVRFPDGTSARQPLAVAPRAWRIEHVNAPHRAGLPDEAYRRRREVELARIAAARAQGSASQGWQQSFIWPSRGRISGVFGAQRVFRGVAASYHSGVDVAAGAGALVVAPADGVVVLAGPPMLSLEGNLVIVDHGMGLSSAFLHLATSSVSVGQPVRQGQPIGTVGATGRATGPHLHWSMVWNGVRIDPQRVAGPMTYGPSAP